MAISRRSLNPDGTPMDMATMIATNTAPTGPQDLPDDYVNPYAGQSYDPGNVGPGGGYWASGLPYAMPDTPPVEGVLPGEPNGSTPQLPPPIAGTPTTQPVGQPGDGGVHPNGPDVFYPDGTPGSTGQPPIGVLDPGNVPQMDPTLPPMQSKTPLSAADVQPTTQSGWGRRRLDFPGAPFKPVHRTGRRRLGTTVIPTPQT